VEIEMTTSAAVLARDDSRSAVEYSLEAPAGAGTRHIALKTSGRRHGPITRLVSPSDIGELIKPFVFLDHAEIAPRSEPLFGIHPHSGIATLTVVLRGGVIYEDTTGKKGSIPTGGVEWMKAGNGVWHDGRPAPGEPLRVFQLWVALPPSEENARPESQYIAPDAVQEDGPVRLLLGRYGRATSPIRARVSTARVAAVASYGNASNP
jgi:redox-sensitive bicupin YhaK (pirin superfamily)